MIWKTIGFEKQKKFFDRAAAGGAIAHAYLFSGPEMIGKKIFARELAAFLIGRKIEDDPDVWTGETAAEGETAISVEDVHRIKKFLSVRPYRGARQVVLIDDAHRMTSEAANALLKILEEPPAAAVMILISSQPDLLPETIRSRCQEIRFSAHPASVVIEAVRVARLTPADRDLIVGMAAGRIGWAVQTAQPMRLKTLKKTIADFSRLFSQPIADRFAYAKTIAEKDQYREYASLWLLWAYHQRQTLPDAPRILKNLLELHERVQHLQYNRRLLLENLLINL